MTTASFAFVPWTDFPTSVLSPCERYRYELRIPLKGHGAGLCLFILANPSTAIVKDGIFVSDPTVTRCQNYARAWGFGVLAVANARSWRETNPKLVPPDPLAIGPDNDAHITRLASEADLVVVGYGKLGGARGHAVLDLVRRAGKVPHALGLNNDGSPKHPLYLRGDAKPIPMGAY